MCRYTCILQNVFLQDNTHSESSVVRLESLTGQSEPWLPPSLPHTTCADRMPHTGEEEGEEEKEGREGGISAAWSLSYCTQCYTVLLWQV